MISRPSDRYDPPDAPSPLRPFFGQPKHGPLFEHGFRIYKQFKLQPKRQLILQRMTPYITKDETSKEKQ